MNVLILVLSAEFEPYGTMMQTAFDTWDSVEVPNMETVFYTGHSDNPNTDKVVHFPIEEMLLKLGHKTLFAFDWALNNREFDFVARVHSSIYVDKIKLAEFVKSLPTENLFCGVEAESQNGFQYQWGGLGFIISKDVVKKFVDNRELWEHKYMEDESMGKLATLLNTPYYPNYAAGIDKTENGWRCISYGGNSIEFSNFEDIKPLGHHYFRVKQDGKRQDDKFVMEQLFNVLK